MLSVEPPPWFKISEFGLAEILKSGGGNTVKVAVVEWVREPMVPVTVTG